MTVERGAFSFSSPPRHWLGCSCLPMAARSRRFVQEQVWRPVNAITVPERHITDAVTAVNFDIRGFDTLGEEFILFTSVLGVVLLMRRQTDEPAEGSRGPDFRDALIPPPAMRFE